jgi:Ser/Thr protein kinase RdoA (MazF antagonist)
MNESKNIWGEETKYFHNLSPENVLEACELLKTRLTGKVLALNSLENRVFDVELAQKKDFNECFSSMNIVLKFYRPGRWSSEQIQEEHDFLFELDEYEVPVVAPLKINDSSLHFHDKTGLYFALFPKVMGRLKDEFNTQELEQAGRLIGRIHNIGAFKKFKHRLHFSPETYIKSNQEQLKLNSTLKFSSFNHYLDLLDRVYALISPHFLRLESQRLHGDFHRGNIVWSKNGPISVDFDDSVQGPVEQDLWPLVPGTDHYSLSDKDIFLNAYKEMTRKDSVKTNLTEIFRTMRLIHFNTWISKRWEDHAFKRMFPQFETENYWDQQFLDLRSQVALIQELH